MNSKNTLKIFIDVLLTAIMILLMDKSATGILWHEALGLTIFTLLILHHVLDFSWIKGVILAFSKRTLKTKTKIMIALNVLLLIFAGGTVLSGIFISKEIFSFLTVGNDEFWEMIHKLFAYSGLILISVHIGINWHIILCVFRKMLCINKKNNVRKTIVRIAALALAAFGVRSSFANNLGQKLLPAFDSTGHVNEDTVKIDVSSSETDNEDKQSSGSITNTQNIKNGKTLEEYLSSLYCNGCHKHCSLLAPQCTKGMQKAQSAEVAFYAENDTADTVEKSESKTETVSENAKSQSSPLKPFTDYLPVMSLYVAGTYYMVEFINRKVKKKS